MRLSIWYNSGMKRTSGILQLHRVRPQPLRRILVAINIGGASGRDALSGFFRFVNAGKRWRLRLLDSTSRIRETLLNETSAPYDGIATDYPADAETVDLLAKSGVPVVFSHFESDRLDAFPMASFVRLDDEDVGRAAADYLLGMGKFGAFAFVAGSPGREEWSIRRERGFRAALEAWQLDCRTLVLPPEASARDNAAFALTLQRLPKPVAVFADWDNAAFRTLEICAEAGIDVPGRVSILGTDNDEVLCRGVEPALSSILPDHVGLGFRVAQELERRMNGGRPRLVVLKASVREILTRDSTRTPQPAEHLIRLARRFIAENDTRNLTPADVVAHLGVSRSLADLRFRELAGETIGEAIAAARIGAVKRKLIATRATVTQVARACGFPNAPSLVRFFKRATGQTPAAWRTREKPTASPFSFRGFPSGPARPPRQAPDRRRAS